MTSKAGKKQEARVFRKGDVVKMRPIHGVITASGEDIDTVQVAWDDDLGMNWMFPDALELVKRNPKVGDRVRSLTKDYCGGYATGTVVAVDGREAWVIFEGNTDHTTIQLAKGWEVLDA